MKPSSDTHGNDVRRLAVPESDTLTTHPPTSPPDPSCHPPPSKYSPIIIRIHAIVMKIMKRRQKSGCISQQSNKSREHRLTLRVTVALESKVNRSQSIIQQTIDIQCLAFNWLSSHCLFRLSFVRYVHNEAINYNEFRMIDHSPHAFKHLINVWVISRRSSFRPRTSTIIGFLFTFFLFFFPFLFSLSNPITCTCLLLSLHSMLGRDSSIIIITSNIINIILIVFAIRTNHFDLPLLDLLLFFITLLLSTIVIVT